MKSCPTCSRTYPDDTLAFCLVDGSILSAPYDPEVTQTYSYPQKTEPTSTQISNPSNKVADTIPSLSSQPIFTPETKQNQLSEKRSGKSKLIIGVIVFFMLIVGVVIGFAWNKWFGNNNSQAKESGSENQNNNTIAKATSSATPSITPQSTPSPKSTPSLTKKVDITGTWTGEFAGRDAILFINSQNGDSFSGILKNTKGSIVAISGHINPDTRQISIQENRVVEEGIGWILGSDTGSLSSDGKRISGNGKDKVGHAYVWAFIKD